MTGPMLVKAVSGWYVLGEDGQRFDLVPHSADSRIQMLGIENADLFKRLAALMEYGSLLELQEEARSWQSVAERLEGEMQDLLHACDCEIRDQTNNRQHSDKQSAAYAEGALRVAKGIAHRIREKSAARG